MPSGKTKNAVEWEITPNVLDGFTYDPVIQHSQVGYHPNQDKIASLHSKGLQTAKELMANKNHDYGEAWREMRISSLTDLILMKILRVKSIEDNEGKTIVSEGLEANYLDMINYAIFALIRLGEAETVKK